MSISESSLGWSSLAALSVVIYKGGGATEEDMRRWYTQGFELCDLPEFQLGLRQGHGGPCGILAVVQAEMLRFLLFEEGGNAMAENGDSDSLPSVTPEQAWSLFNKSLVEILTRAATGRDENRDVVIVSQSKDDAFPGFEPHASTVAKLSYKSYSVRSLSDIMAAIDGNRALWQSPAGCTLFLLSLVMTRGLDRIQSDMDVNDNTLIGQFGHCTQDLINLLITGRATSNVIDGHITMGDSGFTVKGVSHRPKVGYLTHLEALRLCQVGTYFKTPEVPVWVVGSSSHFTVLFSRNKEVIEESQSERLLNKAQRAFKSVEVDDCGFILSDKLHEALMRVEEVPIYELLAEEEDVARLRGFLTSDGDIIIWSTFWQGVSQLCTGSTLSEVVDKPAQTAVQAALARGNGSIDTMQRSDSDLARQLQQQLDGGFNDGSSSMQTEPWPGVTSAFSLGASNSDTGRPRSDSDVARELQRQFDSEIGAAPTPVPPAPIPAPAPPTPVAAPAPTSTPQPEAPSKGFKLYHFNGLENATRPAKLTLFSLTPRTASNVIGQTVQMQGGDNRGNYFNPIEEVLQTRWTDCTLSFDGLPPSID